MKVSTCAAKNRDGTAADFQYKTRLRARSGKSGTASEKSAIALLVRLFGDGDDDAHAPAGLDAFDEAIHFDGLIEYRVGR